MDQDIPAVDCLIGVRDVRVDAAGSGTAMQRDLC